MATLPDFCSSLPSSNKNNDNLLLHPTAQSFLQALNLPSIHPHCSSTSDAFSTTQQQPPAPPMGPLHFWSYHDHDNGHEQTDVVHKACQSFITLFQQVTPALFAMGELWLRLFACVISPLCLCYLLKKEIIMPFDKKEKKKHVVLDRMVCILGIASSAVLFTDSYYVHEYGRMYGGCMFGISTVLSFRCCFQEQQHLQKNKIMGRMVSIVLTGLVVLTVNLLLHSNGGYVPSTEEFQSYPHPGIDLPRASSVTEGLYYSSANPIVKSIASVWPEQSRTYSYENGATPWLPTGDSRTGIPFLVNSVDAPRYKRVWVSNDEDGEAVALDIAFPLGGKKKEEEYYHDFKKPLYLVLHGLNGGSHEEYVKDFVSRRIGEGSTVVVMIARGLMDTPLRGWNGFHGARITDVDAAAKALQSVTSSRNQILAGVGYSMGAIILGNYVARSGKSCHLDTAMIVSGGLDMREQLNFYRSMRLWQPMLTAGLREDIIMGKFARHYKERLTKEQFVNLLRSTSISELDLHAVVAYNSYDDISHYYSDMSAMGDRPSPFASAKNNASSTFNTFVQEVEEQQYWGRFANISIPTCVLHALDDPLVSWRTIVPNNDNPQDVVSAGSGHVMLLLTKNGGHVGWPLGLNPAAEGWKWMNDAVRDFVDSVDKTLREM